MPITFNCPCGKSLRVADEHAGKRIKCPACQTIGTAPTAAPMFEVVEDEPKPKFAPPPAPAKAKPAAAPPAKPAAKPARDEDEDGGFTVVDDEDDKPKAKKKQTFSKGARRDEDDEEEEERPKKKKKPRRREDDDDDEPRRRRSSDPDAGKKIMYLIGGLVMVLIGVAVGVLWWQNGPHTGRRPYSGYVLGGALVFVGLGTAIKGITGNFDDE